MQADEHMQCFKAFIADIAGYLSPLLLWQDLRGQTFSGAPEWQNMQYVTEMTHRKEEIKW